MRCRRNAPIILVGVVFGYFWLSVVGSIICGFIFSMIPRISLIIPMNNNVSPRKIYAGIPFVELYAFILFIPFFGIIFSEVEYFVGNNISNIYLQKIFKHILLGDVQKVFSYILLAPSDKENKQIFDKLWLLHSYNYFFVAFPFLLLSQSFRYRSFTMNIGKKEKRNNSSSFFVYYIYGKFWSRN